MGTTCACGQGGEIVLAKKCPCQRIKHLSMPKAELQIYTIDDLTNIVDEIPTDNDEHTTIHHITIVGVSELDHYQSCLLCHARVEPQTPPDGKCTRSDCLMLQVF